MKSLKGLTDDQARSIAGELLLQTKEQMEKLALKLDRYYKKVIDNQEYIPEWALFMDLTNKHKKSQPMTKEEKSLLAIMVFITEIKEFILSDWCETICDLAGVEYSEYLKWVGKEK